MYMSPESKVISKGKEYNDARMHVGVPEQFRPISEKQQIGGESEPLLGPTELTLSCSYIRPPQ